MTQSTYSYCEFDTASKILLNLAKLDSRLAVFFFLFLPQVEVSPNNLKLYIISQRPRIIVGDAGFELGEMPHHTGFELGEIPDSN